MKTINFNQKQYNVPESWEEVTVGMLINSYDLSDILYDAPLIAIISAYTKIPVKDLRLSNLTEVNQIIDMMNFITKPYEPKPSSSFTFNDEVYSCEDELLDQHFEDWVSIQTTMHNYKDDQIKALPRLIAILCKKYGETLDDFKIDDRVKLFYNLPMTKAKDIEGFFLHSLNAYRGITLLSSLTQAQEDIVLGKLQELQNTVSKSKEQSGMSWLMKLQIGLFQIYLKSWRKQLEKYFNFKPIKSSKSNWMQTFRKSLIKKLKHE